jgi:hypothetical protein
LDLLDKQDDELLARVESEVDQRIAEYQQATDRAGLVSLIGSLSYGGADLPRADQIREGMEYFRQKRQRQREVNSLIAEIRKRAPMPED